MPLNLFGIGGSGGSPIDFGGGDAAPSSAYTDGKQEVAAKLGGNFVVGGDSNEGGNTQMILLVGGIAVLATVLLLRTR
jgi:hypothetical protein